MTESTFPEKFLLTDKVVVVTGGAGLIGREVVKGIAQSGAKVYIADINEKERAKLEKQSKNLDLSVKWMELDINDTNSIKLCISKIVEADGRIDVWINCTYPRTKDWSDKFEDIKYESWKKNVDMHMNGYFLCCQQIAKQMKKQGKGNIINFSSIYGIVGPDFSVYEGANMTMPAAYSAIKGGIIAFTKYLATYYAKHGIRVNVICPGGIYNKQSQSFVKKYGKRTPMGRMGNAEEMVGPLIFLASEASSYVTGHVLVVDGGWTVW